MFTIASEAKITNLQAKIAAIKIAVPAAKITEAKIANERLVIKFECRCRDFSKIAQLVG